MKRRWLLGGAGAAAVLAGVGWREWGERREWRESGSDAAPADGPWAATFEKPEGGTLALADFRGQPLVLNFWATWCPPCIKEMPELDRFATAFAAQGVRVVGLAIDSPTPVRNYLAKSPVGYAIGLAGFEGTELTRKLGNESGALPFTAVFDRSGKLVHKKLGETTFDELSGWVARL